MNSFTSNVPVDQQAATVERLEKRLEELEEQRFQLERRLHFLEYGPPIPVTEFQAVKDRVKNKTDEIEDTKRQLSEAQRPPVDPVDRLNKRLEELEDQLYNMQDRLQWAEINAYTTVADLQSLKNSIEKTENEIEDTKRQLSEAQRPPVDPQNDRVGESTCCICFERKETRDLLALVPCGHRCVCGGCASAMVNKPCPLCRSNTMMAMRVFD